MVIPWGWIILQARVSGLPSKGIYARIIELRKSNTAFYGKIVEYFLLPVIDDNGSRLSYLIMGMQEGEGLRRADPGLGIDYSLALLARQLARPSFR